MIPMDCIAAPLPRRPAAPLCVVTVLPPMRRMFLILCAALPPLLTGCEALQRTDSLFGIITPYRITIVQGNAITKEQAALIKPGLTRLQVREALGTPLVADPFHANRWDYIFTLRRPGSPDLRRSVIVTFEADVVKGIDAPELPSEHEFVASITPFKNLRTPKLELTAEETRRAATAGQARSARRRAPRPGARLPAAGSQLTRPAC